MKYTKGEIQTLHCAILLFSNENIALFLQSACHVFKAWSYASSQSSCDYVSVICVKVAELYSLGCSVFYLQHPDPGLLGPLSIISTRESELPCIPSPLPPPSAPGFLSVVINGTRAPARLTLPVPAMFP